MTNDGYNQITYDYTNHPVKFDNTDYLVEMRYDTLGRRIEKKVTKKADGTFDLEGYVLDGARVISDMVSDGLPVKQYIWGNGVDELLVTAKGRSREYDFYLNNSLGSITHIANKKAEVQESYKYKVYGSVTIFDKKGEITNKSKEKNKYMFTGREWELETKLYYYRARYYSPANGRFYSRDFFKYMDNTLNYYSYAQLNPVLIIDSLGLFGEIKEFKDCGDPFLFGDSGISRDHIKAWIKDSCTEIDLAEQGTYLEGESAARFFTITAQTQILEETPGLREKIRAILLSAKIKCDKDEFVIRCRKHCDDSQAYIPHIMGKLGYVSAAVFGSNPLKNEINLCEWYFADPTIPYGDKKSVVCHELTHYGGAKDTGDIQIKAQTLTTDWIPYFANAQRKLNWILLKYAFKDLIKAIKGQ